MTYGQVRDRVLMLLDRYSVDGSRVDPAYNGQEDLLARIPGLVNDAVAEMAAIRPIWAQVRLDSLERREEDGMARVRLPGDVQRLSAGCVGRADREGWHTLDAVVLPGGRELLIPGEQVGGAVVCYQRRPALLPPAPGEEQELDNDPATHAAAAYYAAAMLAAGEDSFLCSLLYNKYEDRLERLRTAAGSRREQVEDVYWS